LYKAREELEFKVCYIVPLANSFDTKNRRKKTPNENGKKTKKKGKVKKKKKELEVLEL